MLENLTRARVARELKRSPIGVNKAIKRLDLKPVEYRGTRPLFNPGVVEILRESMRGENRSKKGES